MVEFTPKIAMVFPTNLELQPFLELMPELKQISKHPWEMYTGELNHVTVTAIVSYIGPANAAAATERILTVKHNALLHGGSAGAMSEDLMPGDIVVGKSYKILCPRHIAEARKSLLLSNKGIRYSYNGEGVHLEQLDADTGLLAISNQIHDSVKERFPRWNAAGWPKNIPSRPQKIVEGAIGSQDGWTKDPAEIAYIVKEFGVACEDMESAYVAQIAAKHEVPMISIRAISNNEHVATLAKDEIFPAVKEAASRSAYMLWLLLTELTQSRRDP